MGHTTQYKKNWIRIVRRKWLQLHRGHDMPLMVISTFVRRKTQPRFTVEKCTWHQKEDINASKTACQSCYDCNQVGQRNLTCETFQRQCHGKRKLWHSLSNDHRVFSEESNNWPFFGHKTKVGLHFIFSPHFISILGRLSHKILWYLFVITEVYSGD